MREVLDESFAKGWQHVWPKPGNDPRVMFSLVSNPLRRIRAYPLLLKNLWPKLRTVVTIDWRMTSTGMWSDFVLPAAAWYERTEHKWVTPLMPFIHAGEKATSFYEAKSDWEIMARLAHKIDERAAARGRTARERSGRDAGGGRRHGGPGHRPPAGPRRVKRGSTCECCMRPTAVPPRRRRDG